jgi:hypothetical protein
VDPVPEAAARGAEEEGDNAAEGEGGGRDASRGAEEVLDLGVQRSGAARRVFGLGVAILGLPES